MHLIVIMHGMWGSSGHMREIVESIKIKYPQVIIYNSTVNTFFYTFQGIDYCGYRLQLGIQQFILDYQQSQPQQQQQGQEQSQQGQQIIDSISFIGYSAGGLFNRYCIGLLYQQNFFNKIKPIHFITIATPHLGIRHNSRLSTGRISNFIADTMVPIYAGRTGCQMALLDGSSTENQLLYEMSLPNSVFIQALSLFSHLYIYSNANNDHTVPFCTSSLSHKNIYKNISINPNSQTPLTPSAHPLYSTNNQSRNNNAIDSNINETTLQTEILKGAEGEECGEDLGHDQPQGSGYQRLKSKH